MTVDGDRKGSGTLSWRQGEGLCDIVVSMAGHRDARRQLEVVAGRAQTVQLTPQPIYGSASVDSDPMGAEIWIDGKQYGVTPNVVERLLVGSHTLVLKKSGYADLQQQFSVEEGKEASLSVKLPTGRSVQFTSEKPGMQIIVDGKKLGTTPLTAVVGIGHHSVSAMRGGDIIDVRDLGITSAGAPLTMVFRDFVNQTFTVNGVQFTMVAVEGGTFTMGATSEQGSDAFDEEKPAHQVTLSDYYIGRTEVTQALWKAVMGSNPSNHKGDNLPVENVSWYDCQVFIQKLNQLTGKQFRLPTEAEWEYAARGGRKSRGYKYAGSNNIGSVAWYGGNSGGTHLVATKQANELGVYDMSGNVWEWCSDWYGYYYYWSSSQSDPQGPSSGLFRVNRGGCYNSAEACRVSVRSGDYRGGRRDNLGLRLSCNR